MKSIYLNLKRFDITSELNGVNSIAPVKDWATFIVENTQSKLNSFEDKATFAMYFPEAHIINASNANSNPNLKIGCQSIYEKDTVEKGNFGAFTTLRTAKSMKLCGAQATIIGHCEERNYHKELLSYANNADLTVVNQIFNKKIKSAINEGFDVLYCIGETSEEQSDFENVLRTQLEKGLKDVDLSKVTIAYEPVWSIGPGKTPADKPYITKIAQFIKSIYPDIKVVYGGGLKVDNAKMLASIEEIDGGLIALTRFTGQIGFYPDEYINIIEEYLG